MQDLCNFDVEECLPLIKWSAGIKRKSVTEWNKEWIFITCKIYAISMFKCDLPLTK